jgi:hypothetical protein
LIAVMATPGTHEIDSRCRILLPLRPPAGMAPSAPFSRPQPGAEALKKESGGSHDPPEPSFTCANDCATLHWATRRTASSQPVTIRIARASRGPATRVALPVRSPRSLPCSRRSPFDAQTRMHHSMHASDHRHARPAHAGPRDGPSHNCPGLWSAALSRRPCPATTPILTSLSRCVSLASLPQRRLRGEDGVVAATV